MPALLTILLLILANMHNETHPAWVLAMYAGYMVLFVLKVATIFTVRERTKNGELILENAGYSFIVSRIEREPMGRIYEDTVGMSILSAFDAFRDQHPHYNPQFYRGTIHKPLLLQSRVEAVIVLPVRLQDLRQQDGIPYMGEKITGCVFNGPIYRFAQMLDDDRWYIIGTTGTYENDHTLLNLVSQSYIVPPGEHKHYAELLGDTPHKFMYRLTGTGKNSVNRIFHKELDLVADPELREAGVTCAVTVCFNNSNRLPVHNTLDFVCDHKMSSVDCIHTAINEVSFDEIHESPETILENAVRSGYAPHHVRLLPIDHFVAMVSFASAIVEAGIENVLLEGLDTYDTNSLPYGVNTLMQVQILGAVSRVAPVEAVVGLFGRYMEKLVGHAGGDWLKTRYSTFDVEFDLRSLIRAANGGLDWLASYWPV